MQFFGERWDAPIVDDIEQAPTPVGYACLRCEELIVEGDQGFLIPLTTNADDERSARCAVALLGRTERWRYMLTAEHRECQLISVVGHLVGVCTCTGYDTSSRAAAKEAQRRILQRQ